MLSNESLVRALHEKLLQEVVDCANGRKSNIERGAETPELAALIVEKYGHGMARALRLLAGLADCSVPDLRKDVDGLVLEIDPRVEDNRSRRWAARPAEIIYHAPVSPSE